MCAEEVLVCVCVLLLFWGGLCVCRGNFDVCVGGGERERGESSNSNTSFYKEREREPWWFSGLTVCSFRSSFDCLRETEGWRGTQRECVKDYFFNHVLTPPTKGDKNSETICRLE